MEWEWIILFLLVCNIIITILLAKKKKTLSESMLYSSSSSPPTTIGPCGLGCITWLAKNKVCSAQDIENINKGSDITPDCAGALAACAMAYCCSPFCSKKQCGGPPPPANSNTTIQDINGIYNLGYYFPI